MINIMKTTTTVRIQNLSDSSQKYDNCDVCGKACDKERYCCGDEDIIHFDVCSLECAEMGVFQRI